MGLRINYSTFFYFLISIILLNINGVVYLIYGFTGVFSFVILLISIVLLKYYPYQIEKSNSFKLFLLFVILYLLIGSAISPILNELQVGEKYFQTIFDIIKSLLIIISVYSYLIHSKRVYGDFNKPFNWIGILIIFSVLLSYLVHIFDLEKYSEGYRTLSRMSGVFANPNELGTQIIFSIIFVFYFLEISKGIFKKILLLIILLILIHSLFLAFSRSSFIQLFVIGLIFVSIKFGRNTFKIIIITPILIMILTLIANYSYDNMTLTQQKRFDSFSNILRGEELTNENLGDRLYLAETSFDYIINSPFFGKGIGFMQKMTNVGGVHNAYLAIWGNAGIFVLMFFFFFLLVFLKESFVIYRVTNNYVFMFLIIAIIINGISKTGVFEFKINNLIFGLVFAKIYEVHYDYKNSLIDE